MITHIVFFKFKDTTTKEQILDIKAMLENLVELIEPLKTMEVGINFNDSERSMDMSLISTFDTKDGLSTYATHPEHLKVVQIIKELAEYTKVVDYEK